MLGGRRAGRPTASDASGGVLDGWGGRRAGRPTGWEGVGRAARRLGGVRAGRCARQLDGLGGCQEGVGRGARRLGGRRAGRRTGWGWEGVGQAARRRGCPGWDASRASGRPPDRLGGCRVRRAGRLEVKTLFRSLRSETCTRQSYQLSTKETYKNTSLNQSHARRITTQSTS